MNDLISRRQAVDAICKEWCCCSHDDCENKTMMENGFDPCDGCSDVDAIMDLPSAQPNLQPTCNQLATDTISRQAAIDALDEQIEQCNKALGSFDISPKDEYAIKVERASLEAYKEQLENMSSAQPTLCGYNIEHLILIANVLRKENLPPERVVEALTDIGRIVSIVKDEFEESLRKAVEQCKV